MIAEDELIVIGPVSIAKRKYMHSLAKPSSVIIWFLDGDSLKLYSCKTRYLFLLQIDAGDVDGTERGNAPIVQSCFFIFVPIRIWLCFGNSPLHAVQIAAHDSLGFVAIVRLLRKWMMAWPSSIYVVVDAVGAGLRLLVKVLCSEIFTEPNLKIILSGVSM